MDTSKIFNLAAEKELLGAIIQKNDAMIDVIDVLDPTDFYINNNQIIYAALQNMYQSSKGIDLIALAENLGKDLQKVGGITYLTELISSVSSTHMTKTHAEIIKEKSNMRNLLTTLRNNLNDAENGEQKANEISERLQDELLKIKNGKTNDDGSVTNALMDFMDKLQERYEKGGEVQGIQTKFSGLDKTLNGLNKEDFIIVAARPSMGKTAISNNIALNTVNKSKAKVNIFSLEMSKEALLARMTSSLAKVEMDHIKTGKLTDNEWGNIGRITGALSNPDMKIYDKIFTLNGIKAKCKKRKLREGLDVVIIDYLQLIEVNGKFGSREQEVSHISRQLKLMAKELECTVIALSQLSRAPEQRSDHRPMLSDLRESGGIEQDADIVIFLYRDEYYNSETEDKNILEVIVSKNRNGELGTIKMAWLPQFQLVGNLDVMHEPGVKYEGKYNPKQFKKK